MRARLLPSGLRNYIAFAGGILAPRTLGSSARDTLTELGPAPLKAKDRLEFGRAPRALSPAVVTAVEPPSSEPCLQLLLGPRDDWFPNSTVELLATARFEVGSESNRIGLRLSGPPLVRASDKQLLSEALIPGALQVPPSGQPILMLVDHPTTGGYPVIGASRSPRNCAPGRRSASPRGEAAGRSCQIAPSRSSVSTSHPRR
jgi:allophanate hydrolase subunit 2